MRSKFHIGFLWSWRGSNPRPNRGYRRFLHAYSSLDCRVSPRPGPPSGTLASKISPEPRGRPWLVPIYLHHRFLSLGTRTLGWCLVSRPCQPIKLQSTILRLSSKSVVILANYILPSWIIVIGDISLHAYTEAHPAVKASQPQFWGCKDKTYFQKMQIVGWYF